MKKNLLDKDYEKIVIDGKVFEYLLALFIISLLFLLISFGIYKWTGKERETLNKIERQISELNYKTGILNKKIKKLKEAKDVVEKRERHIR